MSGWRREDPLETTLSTVFINTLCEYSDVIGCQGVKNSLHHLLLNSKIGSWLIQAKVCKNSRTFQEPVMTFPSVFKY